MIDANVGCVLAKVDSNLKKWSTRNFSTLGKILIAKTFGISQLICIMQSLEHFKKFYNILYKFLWKGHYSASKAPERIKREIMVTPMSLGGYGMIHARSLTENKSHGKAQGH